MYRQLCNKLYYEFKWFVYIRVIYFNKAHIEKIYERFWIIADNIRRVGTLNVCGFPAGIPSKSVKARTCGKILEKGTPRPNLHGTFLLSKGLHEYKAGKCANSQSRQSDRHSPSGSTLSSRDGHFLCSSIGKRSEPWKRRNGHSCVATDNTCIIL